MKFGQQKEEGIQKSTLILLDKSCCHVLHVGNM